MRIGVKQIIQGSANFFQNNKKYIPKILVTAIAIFIVYCLIPKWEYMVVREKSIMRHEKAGYIEYEKTDFQSVIYRYNKITGQLYRFNNHGFWVHGYGWDPELREVDRKEESADRIREAYDK